MTADGGKWQNTNRAKERGRSYLNFVKHEDTMTEINLRFHLLCPRCTGCRLLQSTTRLAAKQKVHNETMLVSNYLKLILRKTKPKIIWTVFWEVLRVHSSFVFHPLSLLPFSYCTTWNNHDWCILMWLNTQVLMEDVEAVFKFYFIYINSSSVGGIC